MTPSNKRKLWAMFARFFHAVDESFVLSEHPTLNHFLDYIAKMRGEETVAEEVTEETSVTEPKLDVSNNMQGCRRWQVEIEACPGTNAPLTVNGTVVLTIDEWEFQIQ